IPVSFMRDVQFERPDVGALPKRDFGISMLCATRPLIELVLRRQAEAIANITLRPAARVTGIVPAADGAGVREIRFVNGSGCSEILNADLVVDASGRGAPTLTLLDALGWDRPQMTAIGVDISYATAVVELPPTATADWKLVLTQPDPPHLPLHAVPLVIVLNPRNPNAESETKNAQAAAQYLKRELRVLSAGNDSEIDTAFAAIGQQPGSAVMIATDPYFFTRREQLAAHAARCGLPAVYFHREFAAVGGL